MNTLFLVLFFALQLTLLILDLRETRHQDKKHDEPLRLRSIAFLLGVICVYLFIQLGGGRLVPSPSSVLDFVRQFSVDWTGDTAPPPMSSLASLLLGVAFFYTAGFWDYVVHRCFSHSRWFWLTHEYHHLPRQVTVWMPGILARPFGFIPVAISTPATAVTLYAVLILFDFPIWDLQPMLPVILIIVLVLTASHSAFLRRRQLVHRLMRWLWLTTPQEHLLHHGIESRCNYGNFTTLWDRLLGTYQDPILVDLEKLPLGLSYDQDFLGTITLGRLRLSPAQRDNFQIGRYCNINDRPDVP